MLAKPSKIFQRITTRAGISRTAFYFYFRDKRELLMRLTEDVTELPTGAPVDVVLIEGALQ